MDFFEKMNKFDKVYKSIIKEDVFNYQKELERFETELGDWQPLDVYQWDAEYQDEDDETGFVEYTLSYNDKVQVSLKKDGRIDVIDPDKKHRIFKCGDYQRAKKYITSIFKVLDQADRMRWS